MNPAESRSQETGVRNRILLFLGPAGLLALILCAALLSPRCGKSPTMRQDEQTNTDTKRDPWEVIAKRLKKEDDQAACKSALGELSNTLSRQANTQKLPALSAEA